MSYIKINEMYIGSFFVFYHVYKNNRARYLVKRRKKHIIGAISIMYHCCQDRKYFEVLKQNVRFFFLREEKISFSCFNEWHYSLFKLYIYIIFLTFVQLVMYAAYKLHCKKIKVKRHYIRLVQIKHYNVL